MDANKLEVTDLGSLDASIQEQLFTTYVTEYIWGRMLNDLQVCFEKKLRHLSVRQRLRKILKTISMQKYQ